METNSFYYFFSTVAQVLAAITALLAIFAQFKIGELTSYLIGDGEATLKRMEKGDIGYLLPNTDEETKWFGRLRDAIGRKSLLGILESLEMLSNHETQQGKDKERPRGLTYLKIRFVKKNKQLTDLKTLTQRSIILSFIAIIISLICLPFAKYLNEHTNIGYTSLTIVFLLTFLSIIFTIKGVRSGLENTDEV